MQKIVIIENKTYVLLVLVVQSRYNINYCSLKTNAFKNVKQDKSIILKTNGDQTVPCGSCRFYIKPKFFFFVLIFARSCKRCLFTNTKLKNIRNYFF